MASKEEVARFIRSSFRSVWSLELLFLLKREPRGWRRAEIVAALRASELVVAQGLDALTAAGLTAVDEEGGAAYRPVTPEVASLVEASEALYASSPDAVRRMIVSSAAGGLAAFADAFKFWKD
jgi:hypothetical protein